MPLIHSIKQEDKFKLSIWETTEPLSFFEQVPHSYVNGVDYEQFNERRKKEFLATRFLLYSMLNDASLELTYNEIGQPVIANRPLKISFTHSGNRVGVMVSEKHAVALDLEIIHPKVQRVYQKFLSDIEIAALGNDLKTDDLILCWSTKETVYKLMSTPGLSFSGEIHLKLPATGSKGIVLANVKGKELEIFFELNLEYAFTYCFH